MAYPILDFATIQSKYLRDVSNGLPSADTGADSDIAIRANATGSAVEGLYQHQAWIAKQIFPDTADPDMLLRHAAQRGLSLKAAVAAEGSVKLTGQPGASVTSPLTATRQDGVQYQTSGTGTLGQDGTLTLSATAVATGSTTNADSGTSLTVTTPPPGVNSTVSVVSMVGGTDTESYPALLARLLDVLQRPPAGGNKSDFERWAMDVPGVTAAFAYPLHRGPGTVDVLITASGGLPSATTLANAQAYIDAMRPAGMKDCKVLAPTLRTVDFLVAVSVLTGLPADYQPAVATQLANLMGPMAPAVTLVKSQAEALISTIPGIVDRAIPSPAGNVVPVNTASTVEWLRLGNVSVVPL